MALIDRTAYPRFSRVMTTAELTARYTPTADDRAWVKTVTRGDDSAGGLMIMLKCFQVLHAFPALADIPPTIRDYIPMCLALPDDPLVGYPRRSLARHRRAIRAHVGYRAFDKAARQMTIRAALVAARVRDDPADLINVALETLTTAHYELPTFRTLTRIVHHVRRLVNARYFQQVYDRMAENGHHTLGALFAIEPKKRTTGFTRLTAPARNATLTHMQETLDQLTWLENLGAVEEWLTDVPKTKIVQFAAQAASASVSDMLDMAVTKRLTLLACLVAHARVTTRDTVIEMFIKRLAVLQTQGQDRLVELRDAQRGITEGLVTTLADVAEAVDAAKKATTTEDTRAVPADDTTDEADDERDAQAQWEADARLGRRVRTVLAEHGGTDALLTACQTVSAFHGNNYLPLLPPFYRSPRNTIFRLIRALTLHAATQDAALLTALDTVLAKHASHAQWLPDTLDLSFASDAWRAVLRVRRGKRRTYRIAKTLLEICVFSYLAFELRTGDIYADGSLDYADYRADLLSWDACEPLVAAYCQQLDLPTDAVGFVAHLKKQLQTQAQAVDAALPADTTVTISENGIPSLKKATKPPTAPSVAALKTAIYARLPAHNLLHILANTEYWCEWSSPLGPASGAETRLQDAVAKYIVTTFAYGTNLGPVQTAIHMPDMTTSGQLATLNRSHVTAAKLQAANTRLINAYSRFTLPKLWGNDKVAVADGTKIELPENSLFSQYHFRYGGMGGIAYHHISDTYVALFTHFIACSVWEAIYIIDGLLKNTSLLQPDILHADTQGQSTPVFGIALLLGIHLMPRIRNWHDLIFYRPDKIYPADYPSITHYFGMGNCNASLSSAIRSKN